MNSKIVAVVSALCLTGCCVWSDKASVARPNTSLARAAKAAAAATSAADAAVYDVPRLDGLSIDGNAADWGDRGFQVQAMVDLRTGKVRPASNYDPRFRLAWSERGLLVLVEVNDDVTEEAEKEDVLFTRDAIELFLGSKMGDTAGRVQVVISPGIDPRYPELRYKLYDHRKEELKTKPMAAELSRTSTPHGYTLEALLPWDNLGLTPQEGDEVTFQISLNDADGSSTTKAMWYPVDGASWNPSMLHRLRLTKASSPAIRVACTAVYERFRRTRIGVVAAGDLAGHTAVVMDGSTVVASGMLVADGRRASAELIGPMPDPGTAYGPLTVRVDGEEMASVVLPDPRPMRKDASDRAAVRFSSSVFTGSAFPSCDFVQPSLAEDLIGLYRIDTQFYAADFTPVKSAEKPGRYGAVVTITAANGAKYKRKLTLFRQPERVGWRDTRLTGEATLPEGLGIDPQVAKRQSLTLMESFKRSFAAATGMGSEPAILLAGLFETKSDAAAMTQRNDVWAMDRRWWFELNHRISDYQPYEHLVRVPSNYEADANTRHPVIIMLHGSDGSRPQIEGFKVTAVSTFADAHPDFPFIVVTPVCRWGEWWSPDDLGVLLDDVSKRYRIDSDRVYLTGLSMGGFGTWSWAADQPGRFAAIAPICGGGDPGDAGRLKDIPTWIFHGEDDVSVPVQLSRTMAAAISEAGGKPKLTIYPGVNHDSWTRTYADPQLYAWLLEQRLSQRSK